MEVFMVNSKRLVITTVFGAVFGIICMLLTKYTMDVDFWPVGIAFLLNHTVLGVAIGASSIKMNWAAHGVLWGAMFGVFTVIGRIGTATTQQIVIMFVAVVIWGFLIETIATKAFKQPQ
jgi:hypothetical protein